MAIQTRYSQGKLDGFKAVYQITLGAPFSAVTKKLAVNLLNLSDPHGLSTGALAGDVGFGNPFAFPFTTIEDVVVFDRKHLGVLNDNDYPVSVGRHAGAGLPDDNEFIIIELDERLGIGKGRNDKRGHGRDDN